MTFDEWLETKQPMFDEMFPMVQWPAIHEFLKEVYEVGRSQGEKEGLESGKKLGYRTGFTHGQEAERNAGHRGPG